MQILTDSSGSQPRAVGMHMESKYRISLLLAVCDDFVSQWSLSHTDLRIALTCMGDPSWFRHLHRDAHEYYRMRARLLCRRCWTIYSWGIVSKRSLSSIQRRDCGWFDRYRSQYRSFEQPVLWDHTAHFRVESGSKIGRYCGQLESELWFGCWLVNKPTKTSTTTFMMMDQARPWAVLIWSEGTGSALWKTLIHNKHLIRK
jgi:hypothetical protein